MRFPRLTYTNVAATLALFIALGGSSYAAAGFTGANIRNGTLTGSDLEDESVKGRDVANSTLTGADLKTGSVTSSDVDNESLQGSDVKAGELPAGPAGPAGPRGVTDVVTGRVIELVLLAGETKEVLATCLPGQVAVGGGGTSPDGASFLAGAPVESDGTPPEDGDQPTQWRAIVQNPFPLGPPTARVSVRVLCAKP
jgi:hypothetical protein